jgi:hypothetical protein
MDAAGAGRRRPGDLQALFAGPGRQQLADARSSASTSTVAAAAQSCRLPAWRSRARR